MHLSCVEQSYLIRMLQSLHDELEQLRAPRLRGPASQAGAGEHRTVVKAIERQDAPAAEKPRARTCIRRCACAC